MGAKSICDGCGKEAPMAWNSRGDWFKPESWYERSNMKGIQTACSRECIDKVAEKSGKTSVVCPV